MDLTPREREVYELRENGNLTLRDIGVRLGISASSVKGTFKNAQDKIARLALHGNLDRPVSEGNITRAAEYQQPEKAAEFFDLVTEPGFENAAEAMRECGLPKSTAEKLLERIQTNFVPAKIEIERIKTEHFVKTAEKLALRFWDSITDEDIQNIDAYKRVIAGAILVDKRELLDGRPTERISVEDRRALPEIMSRLLHEAEVRGLMPEQNPETQRVTMGFREDAPYQVRAGRERMDPVDVETP